MSATLGIIGAGEIGKRHVGAAVETNVPVAYVVDTDLKRAETLASTCEASALCDVQAVWDDPAVNAVVIGVPNWLHRPLAITALEAGKDVLLEKPVGLSVAECREINEAMSRSGQLVQIGLVHRYTEVVRAVKRMADGGDLGNLYHIKTQLYRRRGVPGLGRWFTNRAQAGGGALIDLGVHLLDIAMHVAGFPRPTEVSGQVYNIFGRRMRDYVYEEMWAGPPDYDGVCDVDDAAFALIKFAGGMTLELNVTWAGNFPDGVLPESMVGVFGERAGVTFELFGDQVSVAKEIAGKNVDERVELPQSDMMAEQMTDFVKAVQTREVRGATAAQGMIIQTLIESIYQSSEQGKAVTV